MSETEVRWCVEEADTGLPVANGCASTREEAEREMMHYVGQYGQDGEVRFWMRQNRRTIKAGTWPAAVKE
jgi:hypothetical protein